MLNFIKDSILKRCVKEIIKIHQENYDKYMNAEEPEKFKTERFNQLNAFKQFLFFLNDRNNPKEVSKEQIHEFLNFILVVDWNYHDGYDSPEYYIHIREKINKEPDIIEKWLFYNIRNKKHLIELLNDSKTKDKVINYFQSNFSHLDF